MRTSFFAGLCFLSVSAFAGDMGEKVHDYFDNKLYLGANGGWGSTTWKGLVPNLDNQNIVISISTPTDVFEGGGVYGGFLGYEISPHFAIEANYLKYPSATVFFDPNSLFSFETDGRTILNTQTEAVSLMAKFMIAIPNTPIRAYSSVGGGGIHRTDELNDVWLGTPAFGVGINIPASKHFMMEIAGNYMAGYGESELNPVQDFIPFLYSIYFRVGLRL